MPREKRGDKQLTVRLPSEVDDRLKRLAVKLSRPGIPVSRTDALRAALLRGLDAFEAEKNPG